MPSLKNRVNSFIFTSQSQLILVLISILAFFRSMDIYFVGDEINHIESAWEGLTDLTHHYFRPVKELTLIIDRFFWGYNHAGYHMTNLILHTANTLLVFVLATRIHFERSAAFIAALLFLLHPIHSTSVYWITGRTDILCTLFYLTGLVFFINYYKSCKLMTLLFSIGSFLLALLSKEMAISFPLVITAYVMAFTSDKRQMLKHSIRSTWPFWALIVLYAVFRLIIAGPDVLTGKVHTNLEITNLIRNLSVFIGLLVIPGGHIEISNFLKSNQQVFTVLTFACLFILLFLIRVLLKRKETLFLTLFVLLTLLPVIRLAMRWYLYLPSVGFCLLVAYSIWKLQSQKGNRRKIAFLALTVILLTYSTFLIVEQSRWLKSGQISKHVTYLIAEKMATENLYSCFLLSVPAEYKETLTLIHGLESLVNLRLRSDFGYTLPAKILSATLISVRSDQDASFDQLVEHRNAAFRLSLKDSPSFFIFPDQVEIAIYHVRPEIGSKFSYSTYDIIIRGLNKAGEVDELDVIFSKPDKRFFELISDDKIRLEPID